MEIQQLKIDIKTSNGISNEMYKAICQVIGEEGGIVMDDGHAPYTEDMIEQYEQLGMLT